MSTDPQERSVRELRADLADVLNAAGVRDQVTFVTSHGRRVAAVVPVAVAEAVPGPQAGRDGDTAAMYAVNVGIVEDRRGIPGRSMAEVFDDYATDLLKEFGGSAERALAAARAVAAEMPRDVGYPARWRNASLAVELCQRAAEMAGPELPGSFRPGSRMSRRRA